MIRCLLYIGILFGFASCSRNTPSLRPGDLLFQVGAKSGMSGAISSATGKKDSLNYTHVGIALPVPGADSVLEATNDGGVRITPLAEFLEGSARRDGHPLVTVMRLRDTTGVAVSIQKARMHLGQPYDYSYRPDNGKMYCSELIWESYRRADGRRIFTARPMNFRAPDGTMPDFWVELFDSLGESIPEGVPGTNPNDMARDAALEEVDRYF